jgi:hypothetical protein
MTVLLPTPDATLVLNADNRVTLYGPHSGVWQLHSPRLLLNLPCDMVKILFGPVAGFVNRVFGESEHPFLAAFAGSPSLTHWNQLLIEAEECVTITEDQLQFRAWRANPVALDRQAERLCRRYGGQRPVRMLQQQRLSEEFVANLKHESYQPRGHFADQSHYIRTCQTLTGFSPTELRNLSDSFYRTGVVFSRLEAYGTWTQSDGRGNPRQPENQNRQRLEGMAG